MRSKACDMLQGMPLHVQLHYRNDKKLTITCEAISENSQSDSTIILNAKTSPILNWLVSSTQFVFFADDYKEYLWASPLISTELR